MSLLITRVLLTAIVIVVAYFAVVRIWTNQIDFIALFKKPSESIPIVDVPKGIIVKPNELDLTTKDWDKTLVFEIKNSNTENHIYSAWIKIWAESEVPVLDEVQLLTGTGENFISQTFGGITANFDLLKITGFDSDKKPCIFLVLYKLAPQESKLFKIKRPKSKSGEESRLKVFLKVSSYSDVSAPIASQENQAAVRIQPPESITIKGISLLLKREN
jgi:hypothetical protein